MTTLKNMDAKAISEMSDIDLAKQLRSLNEDVGPITPNTRPVYERRLRKYLILDEAASCTIPYTPPNTNNMCVKDVTHGVANGGNALTDAGDSAVFFGVQLQFDTPQNSGCHVFTTKDDAIKLIKDKKGGRFKAFSSRAEAEEFSVNVSANSCSTHTTDTRDPARTVPSESSSYRSLKFQELLPFRDAIEAEDVDKISAMVMSNPRYLIGSGDNPTIFHEGCRYNALHMCATKNKPKSCRVILELVEGQQLMQMLYPDDAAETRESRIGFSLDLYLNNPDKRLGETPLHFACKFGFVEMVAVLVSHPGTDKQLRNTDGLTAKDVVCSRLRNASSDVKQKILALFDNLYYVRVVGSVDSSFPAKVAAPWTPSSRQADSVTLCSPFKCSSLDGSAHGSPRETPVTVKACAGPMSASQAEQLHRLWVSPGAVPKENRRRYAQMRRGDSRKGLERIGREISRKMKVSWCEYWEFLDSVVDIESADGLQQFETYLRRCLRELIERRAAEQEREERLQNTSMCQLMQLLNLSDNSQRHFSEDCDASLEACTTWPPSLARFLRDTDAAKLHEQVQTTADGNPDAEQLSEGRLCNDEATEDHLSTCSSESFHTAVDDSDLEFDLVSDWPDGFDWQAVEPLFIYGEQPCQTDADVIRALDSALVISPIDYPLVHQWKNNVLSYPEDVRNAWVPRERMKRAHAHNLTMSTPDQSFTDLNVSDVSLDNSVSEVLRPVGLWQ